MARASAALVRLQVRVDQAHLETVIPSPGGAVLVVNGAFRGCKAALLGINTDKFQAQVGRDGIT